MTLKEQIKEAIEEADRNMDTTKTWGKHKEALATRILALFSTWLDEPCTEHDWTNFTHHGECRECMKELREAGKMTYAELVREYFPEATDEQAADIFYSEPVYYSCFWRADLSNMAFMLCLRKQLEELENEKRTTSTISDSHRDLFW